ncbi:MAG: Uncharacterized UPF0118 membrane protein [uncultured Nocardioidaceae bacterium]|uniref:Uncharacterized UPF0118 membrane protein n=1 Tax=uncultured Nocardioidaceae bacterium TaxID=253824 RepID=A0A6J4MGM7_9ACTN|nr:MAG: Uncharacterized UPF0118 membrane protein [uncultured Nocardioidaceae bacterium]
MTGADSEAAAEPAEDAEAERRRLEASSADFLRDKHPDESGPDTFGKPGRPLREHSPFFIGFFGAVGALVAIWLGQQLASIGSILVLIVVAAFLAIGLNPVVEMLLRRGVRRSLSVLTVAVVVLLTVMLFALAIVPVISDQVTALVERAPEWFTQVRNNDTIEELDREYGLIDRAEEYVAQGSFAEQVFGGVVGLGLAVVSALANTFIIIVLMLYFLASLPSIKRTAYRLAPASRRERVTYLGDQILSDVGRYVSGAFVVALTAGVTSLIFLFVVGLGEYAVALAFVVAVLDVIPMIGATLAAVVVTAIGFATDPRIGIACVVFYILYQQLENYVIYPRVMSRSVDIPGSVIVIAALVGAALLGVVGALLAIPTAAALHLLLREVVLRRQDAR